MQYSCADLVNKLNESIDQVNFEIANNMTNLSISYEMACTKPNLTYNHYYKSLKKKWDESINNFVNSPNKCSTSYSNLATLYELNNMAKKSNILKTGGMGNSNVIDINNLNIDEFVFDNVANVIMKRGTTNKFEMSEDMAATLLGFARVLRENCHCQLVDMFRYFIERYAVKYQQKIKGKSKEQVKGILKSDFEYLKNLIKSTDSTDLKINKTNLIKSLSSKLTGLYGLSVENELDRLIPNELGSMKVFFIKVIKTYYNKLHPIIWAQIFKSMLDNLFEELPFTPNQIFSFVSKHLLLNSGPFILKILQMIRPVLSPELATKYNLTKLTYPKLPQNQIDMIFKKVINDNDSYEIKYNKSASVGHVCIVQKNGNHRDTFVVKIIKPLAIAQSCWEYSTLHNIFNEGSCEQSYIKNNLESNGRELNVKHEIENLNIGHKNYTCMYKDIYSVNIDATLTTVRPLDGIIDSNCWYALAMTLAPGMPVADLVETEQLKNDTKFRANLHRCFDLLIHKYFFTIIQNGFYHGDLHAGNIFYSYKEKKMTLIDFGAVGEIKLFGNDPSIRSLLKIIVMSMFHNFDGILDDMTELLNSKCPETKIDTTSQEYNKLRQELKAHKINNIKNSNTEKGKSEKYKNDVFSSKRINDEIESQAQSGGNSIYSTFDIKPEEKETVVENKDVLPVFTEIVGDGKNITFSKVLEMIIKFYAMAGVNVAIKFSDLYEFQKAYALLLGVLHKAGYSSYRYNMAMKNAIMNWKNLKKIYEIKTIYYIINLYTKESEKYKKNGGLESPDDKITLPEDLNFEKSDTQSSSKYKLKK